MTAAGNGVLFAIGGYVLGILLCAYSVSFVEKMDRGKLLGPFNLALRAAVIALVLYAGRGLWYEGDELQYGWATAFLFFGTVASWVASLPLSLVVYSINRKARESHDRWFQGMLPADQERVMRRAALLPNGGHALKEYVARHKVHPLYAPQQADPVEWRWVMRYGAPEYKRAAKLQETT